MLMSTFQLMRLFIKNRGSNCGSLVLPIFIL